MLLDIEVGPDGAIYAVNYQGWFNSTPETSIDRLEYIGPACAAQSSLIVEKAGCQDSRNVEFDATATHPWPEACITLSTSNRQLVALPENFLRVSKSQVLVSYPGDFVLSILTMDGRMLKSIRGRGITALPLDQVSGKGLGIVQRNTSRVTYQTKLLMP